MTLGDKIRAARVLHRLSQERLGSKVGTTGSSVSRWENNEDTPSGKNLIALTRELHLPPGWYLDEAKLPTAPLDRDATLDDLVENPGLMMVLPKEQRLRLLAEASRLFAMLTQAYVEQELDLDVKKEEKR